MTNNTRPGRYYSSFLAADLAVGDYVLMDRINGYLKITEPLSFDGPTLVITGVSEDDLTHYMTPTAPMVSAWVAHR